MSSTILFIDDHDILYRSRTQRVLNSPVRHHTNPLIKSDRPWETAIAWTSAYRDQHTGKYQLWYQAFAGDRAIYSTHRCVVCYAESDDGIRFTKPDLNLFNFNKIKNTNIVLIGNGGHSLRYANSFVLCSSIAAAHEILRDTNRAISKIRGARVGLVRTVGRLCFEDIDTES